ncbi:hypothetical protein CRG49_005325 [Neisseria sp. N95_16]|uniref:Uncharacterized protein n=1 Tax=Neisseria brasiliensis TaxID=2666100 RepID=A0A7X2KXY0_9NEIS|nr:MULTISPECIES: hypothetical protein [Neisseria]MRN38116.1 hypothetical protein [Neisseria brasiliensis]PJO09899.1 hypothetical protein CRG49_005325 [Neisseria sp. N95_16]
MPEALREILSFSNTANNLGEGKMTWGDITGTLATIAVGTFTIARTGNAPIGIAAGGYTGGWVKNVTNDAVNVPPYNGRPIFEIEHGLTEIPKSKDKSGNNYGG